MRRLWPLLCLALLFGSCAGRPMLVGRSPPRHLRKLFAATMNKHQDRGWSFPSLVQVDEDGDVKPENPQCTKLRVNGHWEITDDLTVHRDLLIDGTMDVMEAVSTHFVGDVHVAEELNATTVGINDDLVIGHIYDPENPDAEVKDDERGLITDTILPKKDNVLNSPTLFVVGNLTTHGMECGLLLPPCIPAEGIQKAVRIRDNMMAGDITVHSLLFTSESTLEGIWTPGEADIQLKLYGGLRVDKLDPFLIEPTKNGMGTVEIKASVRTDSIMWGRIGSATPGGIVELPKGLGLSQINSRSFSALGTGGASTEDESEFTGAIVVNKWLTVARPYYLNIDPVGHVRTFSLRKIVISKALGGQWRAFSIKIFRLGETPVTILPAKHVCPARLTVVLGTHLNTSIAFSVRSAQLGKGLCEFTYEGVTDEMQVNELESSKIEIANIGDGIIYYIRFKNTWLGQRRNSLQIWASEHLEPGQITKVAVLGEYVRTGPGEQTEDTRLDRYQEYFTTDNDKGHYHQPEGDGEVALPA